MKLWACGLDVPSTFQPAGGVQSKASPIKLSQLAVALACVGRPRVSHARRVVIRNLRTTGLQLAQFYRDI